MASDRARQAAGLLTALANPLMSWLPQLTGTGRTIAEQSDRNPVLLVPWGPAFSIWGVIFAGVIAFAVLQALPANRERAVFRASGWWVAAASATSALWALAASYAPESVSGWLTAALFVPLAIAAARGMVALTAHRADLSTVEIWLAWAGPSLFAGWVGLAAWINAAQVLQYEIGLPPLGVALAMLACALAWLVWNLSRAAGNAAFAFAGIWGLGFLAYDRLAVEPGAPLVGYAAIGGAALLVGAALAFRGRAQPRP